MVLNLLIQKSWPFKCFPMCLSSLFDLYIFYFLFFIFFMENDIIFMLADKAGRESAVEA
jgi:hypothetical protein